MAVSDFVGPIVHKAIAESTAATHIQVAGVTGMRILVVNLVLVAAGAVAVTLEDEDGTDLSGPMTLGTNSVLVLPDSNAGWVMTASGKGLNILLGGGVAVAGSMAYRMVPAHYAG